MSEDHYSEDAIGFLGVVWGEGYMSPGGTDEVARVLDGLDLTGMTVLDVGSGAGGVAIDLIRRHGAGNVIGIDVEAPVCAASRALVERKGLSDQIEILHVEPGPWPLGDASVDLVFSKDSIIHIADKEWLSREAIRVLRPGGWFAASDWLISHDGPPSPAMADYIAAEGLDFAMASPERYERALKAAGFQDVVLTNRNRWYREEARRELEAMKGKNRAALESAFGTGDLESNIAIWEKMLQVIETGEHCPHHLRGRKP